MLNRSHPTRRTVHSSSASSTVSTRSGRRSRNPSDRATTFNSKYTTGYYNPNEKPITNGFDHQQIKIRVIQIRCSNYQEDALKYYTAKYFVDCPIRVTMVVKVGKPMHQEPYDFFVQLWERVFENFFHGGTYSQIPKMDASFDIPTSEECQALGRVLGHGFSLTGYLPLHSFNKASLLYVMTGCIAKDDELCEAYLSYLNEEDNELIKLAQEECSGMIKKDKFSDDINYAVIDFFHSLGIRMLPNPKNLQILLTRVAVHCCIEKPHFILANMRTGLTQTSNQWKEMTIEMANTVLESVDTTGQYHPDISSGSPPMSRSFDLKGFATRSLSSLTSSGFWRSGNMSSRN